MTPSPALAKLSRPEKFVKLQSVAQDLCGSDFYWAALPPHDACAPGQAAAQRLHQDKVTRPDPAVGHRFVEGERDRCRRGVGMALDRDDGPLGRQPKPPSDRVDDACVSLMR